MLLLVDAAGLYYRAFHGVPTSVTAPDGTPMNAVRGYLDMTARILAARRPDRCVACLDLDWRPAFRVTLLPSYKAHRVGPDGGEAVPAALVPQVPVLRAVLAALGLATAGADGFEADDVIATLAAREPGRCEILTADRDLLAVVDERVRVLSPARGIAKLAAFGPAEVLTKYGVPAARYADFAALRGDPSDGLPGVPGVGAKTAAALVARFGTVEQIVAAADAAVGGTDAAGSAGSRATDGAGGAAASAAHGARSAGSRATNGAGSAAADPSMGTPLALPSERMPA
ncbi:MAG: 5'-3' exonuclease, partial [Actinomycetia bacterium]|nr:5'-3' exonuclease [Actinomycetes bacterium]